MKQKLEQNELENVSGGKCVMGHELVDKTINVYYHDQAGKFKSGKLTVVIYADTEKDEQGNSIEDLCKQYCNNHGYSYINWD